MRFGGEVEALLRLAARLCRSFELASLEKEGWVVVANWGLRGYPPLFPLIDTLIFFN